MTDKVIANIKEKYDSIDDLDGLDELKYLRPKSQYLTSRDEDRNMIKEAIERGSSISPIEQ